MHLDFSVINWSWGLIFFMRDRSYQWLKDATSFGLLSDKSTEKLKGENLKFCQNGQNQQFLAFMGMAYLPSDVMHMHKGYF